MSNQYPTIVDSFCKFEKEKADQLFLAEPVKGIYQNFSWAEAGNEIRSIANYLKNNGLNKGDKVFKNSDTEAMLFNNELNGILMNNGISSPIVNVNQEVKIDTKGIIDAINSKVGLELNFDANGFSKYKKSQGQRIQLINNRLNIRGYDI